MFPDRRAVSSAERNAVRIFRQLHRSTSALLLRWSWPSSNTAVVERRYQTQALRRLPKLDVLCTPQTQSFPHLNVLSTPQTQSVLATGRLTPTRGSPGRHTDGEQLPPGRPTSARRPTVPTEETNRQTAYYDPSILSPRFHGHLKAAQWCDQAYAAHRTPVIHVQGGFKVPMETGRNLEHTTERHQRGFKVPMETGSISIGESMGDT